MRQLLRKIAHKFIKPQTAWPEAPIKALDAQYSMILSQDDDPHQPTRELIELALRVIRRTIDEVNLDDLLQRAGPPDYFPTLWPGEHYRLLAGFLLELKPKVVIEIGTFTGLSSLAMKKYLPADGLIATFDVIPWKNIPQTLLRDDDFADGRLVQHVGNLADLDVLEKHRALLESAPFLFIDGPKDTVTEFKFIENFKKLQFKTPPILLFDDTRLWTMLKFWRTLAYPKLDLTSFGHWSGTGLVQWT